ncbi:MAG TPA: hypothetical protein VFX21_02030 [Acidimicrobiia bacterium]|nr:hypothetical protein [Acidimicrobiia bacterium]
MADLVIHAGMPKTGSSAVQRWLKSNLDAIAANGFQVRRRPRGLDEATCLDEVTRPGSHIGVKSYVDDLLGNAQEQRALLDDLHALPGTALLTSEALNNLFHRDAVWLSALNDYAAIHDVRVAYYVRPQHDAMEASWRQWGFRRPMRPSVYLERREGRRLDFLSTLMRVRECAPNVSFEMRGFRRDLLVGGDIVVDFADTFLGMHAEPVPSVNEGLPLFICVLIQARGASPLWESHHENATLRRVQEIVSRWDMPEPEDIQESLLVLQRHCRSRYEDDNRKLISLLNWPTEDYVPPTKEAGDDRLSRLDVLWRPRPEGHLLRQALADIIATSDTRDARQSRPSSDRAGERVTLRSKLRTATRHGAKALRRSRGKPSA